MVKDKQIRLELLKLTTDIVAARVGRANISDKEMSDLINETYQHLEKIYDTGSAASKNSLDPAVPVNESVQDDYIVCLEDGKPMKMLRRYLMATYGMTPEEYREKWNLPADYPMTAPSYSEKRRGLAKKMGLGKSKDD